AVVFDQVPDQRAHARLVVAANVHRALLRASGQRDDGDRLGELADGGGGQHAVVEDHAVGLAGDGRNAGGDLLVGVTDRAHQHVEAAALRGDVDASVDDVDEEEAFVLALEVGLLSPSEDDPHDFLQAVGERPGRTVGDEAKLLDRANHALAGVGARAALAVENPGHRGDGDAGLAGDVVDRQRPLEFLDISHRAWTPQTDLPADRLFWRCGKRLPVSAYRIIWSAGRLSRVWFDGGRTRCSGRHRPETKVSS